MQPVDIKKQIDAILIWYRSVKRDLPWRETRDPYAIWISEIMLQQTQVATVLPYYHRFLTRFPTIRDLAEAPLDDVLKVWEGLGYYSRARNLHKAARLMLEQRDGTFPSQFEDILALPGIGQSTAGAIATFAFQDPHPILDGNVKRVLSRLYAINLPIQDKNAIEQLWEHSSSLLPADPQDAYDMNQALMELGAVMCTPKKPSCNTCPVQFGCLAHQQGLQDTLPIKTPKKASPHYTIGVGVVWKDDRILIALRPAEGLLGGLWEFPGGKCKEHESLKACVEREILEETGLQVQVGAKLAEVKHAYTHFKITLHAFDCHYLSGTAQPKASQELKWVTLEEINQYAFPKANKTVLETLQQNRGHQLTLC